MMFMVRIKKNCCIKNIIEAATITDDLHLMRWNQNHYSKHAKLFRTSSINKWCRINHKKMGDLNIHKITLRHRNLEWKWRATHMLRKTYKRKKVIVLLKRQQRNADAFLALIIIIFLHYNFNSILSFFFGINY